MRRKPLHPACSKECLVQSEANCSHFVMKLKEKQTLKVNVVVVQMGSLYFSGKEWENMKIYFCFPFIMHKMRLQNKLFFVCVSPPRVHCAIKSRRYKEKSKNKNRYKSIVYVPLWECMGRSWVHVFNCDFHTIVMIFIVEGFLLLFC